MAENKSWVVALIVPSFIVNLTWALFILRIALYTYLKLEVRFWISKNVASSFFGYSKLNIHRGRHYRCSIKKGVLRNFANFTGKHLCKSLLFKKLAGLACHFIEKVTLAQVFSCEYCEICKSTFFTEHLWTAASLRKYMCKKHIISIAKQNALNISLVPSAAIFSTTIEYGISSSSIWVFSHLVRGWLAGISNSVGSSCNR